jgi:hypothetical protein
MVPPAPPGAEFYETGTRACCPGLRLERDLLTSNTSQAGITDLRFLYEA